MAKAGWHSTTSVTWIPIRDAYPAILEICLSPSLCESWFIERAAAGRLRCQAKKGDANYFWRSPSASPPRVDFAACAATRDVVTQIDGVFGFVREALQGIEVVREDLEEALGMPVKAAAQAAVIQWPWREDPKLLAKEGTEPRRVQFECEKKFDPALLRSLSAVKIWEALAEAGVNNVSVSAIERAFTGMR